MIRLWDRLPGWARRLGLVLAGVQAVLALAYVARSSGPWGSLPHQLDLNAEGTIGVWWGSALFLATGAVALGIRHLARREGDGGAHWLVVGLGFTGLSLEEVASIHESVGVRVGDTLGADVRLVWPLLYSPLLLLGTWALERVARELDPVLRRGGALALALLVGVIAAEVLSAWVRDTWLVLLEESAELAGCGVLLLVLATTLVERLTATIALTTAGFESARRSSAARSSSR